MAVVGSDDEGSDPPGEHSFVPPPRDRTDPRAWCAVAAARLARDQPEAALDAARQAMGLDPGGDWSHRLASLALERLGRDSEAVAAAQDAVRLAPGSWAARLRLAASLRRTPQGWRDAWIQAGHAARFAPERPGPHVLIGDLSLLRGDHEQAARAYRTALRRDPGHAAAHVNLGLTLLRWERPRNHHDPAWPIDPRETGRTRQALASWSRQVRLLLAIAVGGVTLLAVATGLRQEARLAGAALLLPVVALTVRQARRVTAWPYLPAMLGRDLWLSMSVSVTVMLVLAYPAAIAVGGEFDGVLWAALLGLALFNGVAMAVLRVLVETWRGRPVAALSEFAAASGVRAARRGAGVTLWAVTGRLWSLALLPVAATAVTGDPRAGLAALLVLAALAYVRARCGPYGRAVAAADRALMIALAAILLAAAFSALAGVVALFGAPGPDASGLAADVARAASWPAAGALAVAALAFTARVAAAWWRGAPGATRASLTLYEPGGRHVPEDAGPSPELDERVRRAFTFSRGVVLAYADEGGPRALAVGAITSVAASGELSLIVADEAWEAADRDPRVAVFVADPVNRRFWAEVRGVALGDFDDDVLRVTPKQVIVGEYPGRHQARAATRR
ncbi:hypothetical protein AB0K60_00835 [Thermopolyspora sp. NPDC052614]|uniref:tetratricopeptide repeat protein n=1 Tax=Thermopolyspora sp. NPDC052614 TaxID=3155682 RepID=UPI003449E084